MSSVDFFKGGVGAEGEVEKTDESRGCFFLAHQFDQTDHES